MGIPPSTSQPSLSVALVIFVLTPEGRVETLGGEELTSGRMAPIRAGGPDISHIIRREVEAVLPVGTVTSRIRPLMPRLRGTEAVTLPLWATGRVPESVFRAGGVGELRGLRFGALERLALSLRDESLVAEARSEFRRALASDPVSHQLMGDATRLRALAVDELARESLAGDEMPPIFGLLPRAFTLDELHMAVNEAAHLPSGEVEKSTNFRRRLVDLVRDGVLAEVGERSGPEQRGRPAKLYAFSVDGWRLWLSRQHRAMDARIESRMERLPSVRMHADRVFYARAAPSRPVEEARADDPAIDASPVPPDRLDPALLKPSVHRSAARMAPPNRAETAPEEQSRVDRLESMMRELMQQVAHLKKPRRGSDEEKSR